MARHNELGKLGEEMAADFLKKQGYSILQTNFTYQKAEIDIIARLGDVLAIVEVKTRSSTEFGLPQEFVKPKKIRLLVKAVNEYIEQNSLDVETRFDIISIYKENGQYEIEHLQDAFFHF
ncbi:endonuclease [Flavobacterium cyanobacteriorum]|uniref:UPF0102 protein CHU92_08850 n=1 Tax=Flavobacterium cyanobacteriorum TaxID=2022802 RepID=A0A255Z6T1_9FLAO|nr:YraN family protein [Flavobacterium cyanobacteriorum]OYQ37131.1 endonuclease [Flavobacterium cyanobacteriorum]